MNMKILSTLVMFLIVILSLGAVNAQAMLVLAPPDSEQVYKVDFCVYPFIIYSSVNCAPSITSAPVTSATVGQVYTYDVDATDPNGDTLTYLLDTFPQGMNINSLTGIISWVPLSSHLGGNSVTVRVTDGMVTKDDIQTFSIIVTSGSGGGTSASCSNGEIGNHLEIEDLDFDDDVGPGDDLEVTVEVANNGDDDVDDVKIKVSLVDLDENKVLESETSSSFDLDDDDEEERTITLEIPSGIDDSHDYVIIVKAYEKGNEDEHCAQDQDDIDIDVEDDDLRVEKFNILPSTLSCGDSGELVVEVENVGEDDQEDAQVRVSGDLNVFGESEFDLDEGDDITRRFSFFVPRDATNGIYLVQVSVFLEDGDLMDTESRTITVSGCPEPEEDSTDDVVITFGGGEGRDDFGRSDSVQPTSRREILDLVLWGIADLALLVIVISMVVLVARRVKGKRQESF